MLPARVMVLSAVSRAAATSGPVRKCGHCKVHNGLTRAHGPDRAIACTSPAARLIGTPRKRTISAGEVSHGRSNEPGWTGSARGGAGARVWRSGARAWRPDVTPAQDRGSAAAVARGRPGDRLA